MCDNTFQKLVKYNKWNIEILRKAKEKILFLHLEKKTKKTLRKWSKNHLTPTCTETYNILFKKHAESCNNCKFLRNIGQVIIKRKKKKCRKC